MDERKILEEAERLLYNKDAYRSMAKRGDLFGDGHAAEKIVEVLRREGL